MQFKNTFNNIFSYKEKNTQEFLIPSSPNNIDESIEKEETVFEDYNKTLEYIKIKYSLLINSDINLREFEIDISGKKFNACLIFVDGIVDSKSINDFILSPIFLKNSIKMNSKSTNNTFPKVKKTTPQKFDLKSFLEKNLISQNSIKLEKNFSKIFEKINSGFCALFVDTLDVAICFEIKKFPERAISEPLNENVVKGPHEAFTENIRTNTALIRKIVNNENLIIENLNIGKVTNTSVCLCYIKTIANDDLVAEAKFRLNNIDLDSLISSGQLENLIKDDLNNVFPEVLSTERPDRTSNFLLNGRVAVIVNGSPYALILPAILLDFLASTEDLFLNHFFANFLKIVRAIALVITLLLPGTYIAVTIFHDEFLPTQLIFAIISAREKIPFPIVLEIIIMEISFELIREAGVRVPSAFGQTIGIVGALILGEASVTANIVSPILVIIVAITGISEFALPDFSFSFGIRIFRFMYIVLGYLTGLFGIACGIFIHLCVLMNASSFGVPLLSYTSFQKYSVRPIWKADKRPKILNTKQPDSSPNISMPWRKTEK